jgi:Ca2+/Na+ antiporter
MKMKNKLEKNKILLKINLYFCQFVEGGRISSLNLLAIFSLLHMIVRTSIDVYTEIMKGFFLCCVLYFCGFVYKKRKDRKEDKKGRKETKVKEYWNMQSCLKLKFPHSAIILPHFSD